MSYFATDVLERCDVTPYQQKFQMQCCLYDGQDHPMYRSLKLLHVDDVMVYTLDTSPIIISRNDSHSSLTTRLQIVLTSWQLQG